MQILQLKTSPDQFLMLLMEVQTIAALNTQEHSNAFAMLNG